MQLIAFPSFVKRIIAEVVGDKFEGKTSMKTVKGGVVVSIRFVDLPVLVPEVDEQ